MSLKCTMIILTVTFVHFFNEDNSFLDLTQVLFQQSS